jgi:hypothetical protein
MPNTKYAYDKKDEAKLPEKHRRHLHAGLGSTLCKVRRLARIEAGLRPDVITKPCFARTPVRLTFSEGPRYEPIVNGGKVYRNKGKQEAARRLARMEVANV